MGNVSNLIPFKPGQSGNPGGRAVGARNKLQGDFLHALAEDFATHGIEAIQQARAKNPVGYIRAIVALMPKQFEAADPSKMGDEEVLAKIKEKLAARQTDTGESV